MSKRCFRCNVGPRGKERGLCSPCVEAEGRHVEARRPGPFTRCTRCDGGMYAEGPRMCRLCADASEIVTKWLELGRQAN